MRIVSLLLTLVCVMSFNLTHAKIGYFWHITDFHYDPLYTAQGDTRRHCRRADERGSSGHHRALGRLGDYSCDSSLELIQSALRYMRTRHSENVEFVLWTGDIVAVQYSENEDNRYQAIRNITELLRMTFSSHFVFPVLGHTDPAPSESLTNLWSHWLPMEALQTLKLYGYYTIEQSHSKLRIVALNTNLFSHSQANSLLARRQWEWLEEVLDKATANNEMVYIVGHAAPGSDSRYNAYSVDANAKFLNMVRRHARIIAGQFFGHLHVDTFRVIYDKELPVSWAFLAPSLSPHHDPAGSSNPGLRLYKFDSDTGKVLDYTQFYLDLAVANRAGVSGSTVVGSDWVPEYNLTQYYGLRDVSAESLHHLADKLRIGTAHELTMFNKYLRAYNVKHDSSDNCDGACAHQHYCAITCLEHIAYRQCVEAAASALAASGRSASLVAPLINVTITLIIILDYTQFYLDLAVANRAGASGSAVVGSDWVPEYNLTQYYGLKDVSAESLHHLADKLRIGTAHELNMFNKFRNLRTYNVNDSSDNCDGACAHQHYCAITCLEHIAYRQCVEAAASALAASGRSASLVAPLINVTITLIIVLDYTQFYLDLAVANRAGASGSPVVGSDWVPEYNLTQYYGLRDVSAESLHHLADKLRIGRAHELTMFNKYLRAYNVKHDSSDNCDGACAHQHYCAITCLEHIAYRQCVEAAASALAASGRSASLVAPLINVTITLIIIL